MVDIKIRELKKQDIDTLAEINITSFPWTSFKLTHKAASKFLQDRLDKQMVYVAVKDNQVIGFIAMKRDFLFGNYIRRIVIREDMRSKGIGSQLVNHIEELTFGNNIPNLYLICTTTNAKAIAFYIKNGFKIIGEITNFVDEGLDEYILRKTVGTINEFKLYD
ncbi:MAG: GNAT family N-acetyltransferase [Candidatus Heimdallarchaeota archaeon]